MKMICKLVYLTLYMHFIMLIFFNYHCLKYPCNVMEIHQLNLTLYSKYHLSPHCL